MRRLARGYGASPAHLAAHVALFALAAFVIGRLKDAGGAENILKWFVLAILLHDLVGLPLYSVLDRGAARVVRGPAVNYVRIPAALSGLLFLVFFPAILGRNEATLTRVSGLTPDGYMARWLLVCAALFAGSALLWLVRGRSAARRRLSSP